jgi:2,3,4,5-tetrahydropyridine-2-carboxylate N-succinyltransferase
MDPSADREIIESAFEHRTRIASEAERNAVAHTLRRLESGELRVAERDADGTWKTLDWIKKAILLHFAQQPMKSFTAGDLVYHDKIGLRSDWPSAGVRVVPGAIVREGAHVAPGAILMPCFVNIGAHIGEGTMIDTWATVGSCAQVGRHCHVSGGVGIGGVLEPLQANPVIIEDHVFIGARCEVAEGVIVREGAVIAMGCMIGASTRIYNAMTGEVTHGEIPARAVVVPGSLLDRSGTHHTQALIIKKWRDEKTDARTELNALLR